MEALLNEEVLRNVLQELVRKLVAEMLSKELSGHTWGIDEFRKTCCGGKERAWVTTFILDKFLNEIDYYHGGWLIRGGRGKANIIFANPACEWMEKNRPRIDWEAKIPK